MSLGCPRRRSLRPRPRHEVRGRSRPRGCRSAWQQQIACSYSLKPGADAVSYLGAWADVARGRWQDVEERLAVVAAEDSVVEDDHRAPVRRAPDQPAETLLEPQRRLRERELRKRVADLLGARGVHGIGGHRKRQPDHDHAAEPLARDVDALPEARGAKQERAIRFLKRFEQLPALAVDALAEDENLVEVHALLERGVHVAQLAMRGEEDEGAPTHLSRDLSDELLHRHVKRFMLWRRKVGGQAYQRLVIEIEMGRKDHLLDLRTQTDARAAVVERATDRERR